MVEVREISESQTAQAADALLLLPRWRTREALVDFIDTHLRPAGYRLAGAFESGSATTASVVGFRGTRSTAWGHYLYVDDVSTLAATRGRGYADIAGGYNTPRRSGR